MSRWQPEFFRRRPHAVLGVDAKQLAWQSAAGQAPSLSEPAVGIEQALAALSPGGWVDVIASNDLAVHWLQSPPSSVQSLAELKLVAQLRCTQLYGGTPQDWRVAGDWNIRHPFVCAGLPAAVTEPVNERVERHGSRIRWQTAWGLLCAERAAIFPAKGWSALQSPRRVMLWHCHEGRVTALTSLTVDAQTPRPEIEARVRQALQLQVMHDEQLRGDSVHWVDLTQPATFACRAIVPPIPSESSEALAALGLLALCEAA